MTNQQQADIWLARYREHRARITRIRNLLTNTTRANNEDAKMTPKSVKRLEARWEGISR